jgi:ketosteroid isomerase-like protein
MKQILLVIVILIGASSVSLGQCGAGSGKTRDDREALKELIKEWADAAVHADLPKLDKMAVAGFKGSAEGISFDKKMLLSAIRNGQMKVASWDCDDVSVEPKGNAAVVVGRCTLTNATYMGKDFSGRWQFTDRFVKEKDGTWRAVNMQSKRIKQ